MGTNNVPWMLIGLTRAANRTVSRILDVSPRSRGVLKFRKRLPCETALGHRALLNGTNVNQTAFLCTIPSSTSDAELNTAVTVLRQYSGGSVNLEKDSATGIAVITLNNPKKKNALSGSMMVELSEAVTNLEHWEDGKGVILRGADQFFCSGAELGMVRDAVKIQGRSLLMATLMHDVTSRIVSLPMLSVALIEGGALGGGAELTTCCDFRIATEDSSIAFLQVKLGVVTGFGGGTRLVQILGRTKSLDILCSSRYLSAQEAEEIGFVSSVLANENGGDALEHTKQWLSRFCHGSVQPLRATKTIVHSASLLSAEDSLRQEKDLFVKVWGNQKHRKAIGLKVLTDS